MPGTGLLTLLSSCAKPAVVEASVAVVVAGGAHPCAGRVAVVGILAKHFVVSKTKMNKGNQFVLFHSEESG